MQQQKKSSSRWMNSPKYLYTDISDDDESIVPFTPCIQREWCDNDSDFTGPQSVSSFPPSVGTDQETFMPTPHSNRYAYIAQGCMTPFNHLDTEDDDTSEGITNIYSSEIVKLSYVQAGNLPRFETTGNKRFDRKFLSRKESEADISTTDIERNGDNYCNNDSTIDNICDTYGSRISRWQDTLQKPQGFQELESMGVDGSELSCPDDYSSPSNRRMSFEEFLEILISDETYVEKNEESIANVDQKNVTTDEQEETVVMDEVNGQRKRKISECMHQLEKFKKKYDVPYAIILNDNDLQVDIPVPEDRTTIDEDGRVPECVSRSVGRATLSGCEQTQVSSASEMSHIRKRHRSSPQLSMLSHRKQCTLSQSTFISSQQPLTSTKQSTSTSSRQSLTPNKEPFTPLVDFANLTQTLTDPLDSFTTMQQTLTVPLEASTTQQLTFTNPELTFTPVNAKFDQNITAVLLDSQNITAVRLDSQNITAVRLDSQNSDISYVKGNPCVYTPHTSIMWSGGSCIHTEVNSTDKFTPSQDIAASSSTVPIMFIFEPNTHHLTEDNKTTGSTSQTTNISSDYDYTTLQPPGSSHKYFTQNQFKDQQFNKRSNEFTALINAFPATAICDVTSLCVPEEASTSVHNFYPHNKSHQQHFSNKHQQHVSNKHLQHFSNKHQQHLGIINFPKKKKKMLNFDQDSGENNPSSVDYLEREGSLEEHKQSNALHPNLTEITTGNFDWSRPYSRNSARQDLCPLTASESDDRSDIAHQPQSDISKRNLNVVSSTQPHTDGTIPHKMDHPVFSGQSENITVQLSSTNSVDGSVVDLELPENAAPELIEAYKKCTETGNITPIVKHELKCAIMSKRFKEGKGDIEIKFEPPVQNERTDEDIEKENHRKTLNNRAAANHRHRKKEKNLLMEQECETLTQKNLSLKHEVSMLESEKHLLLRLLLSHGIVIPPESIKST